MDEVLQIVSGENENAGTDSLAVCERTNGKADKTPAKNIECAMYKTPSTDSVEYPPNYGNYDGGVEAGLEGEWDTEAFLALKKRLDEASGR